MRRIIRCSRINPEFQTSSLIIYPTLSPTLKTKASDHPTLKHIFHPKKIGSLENNPSVSPTVNFLSVGLSDPKGIFSSAQQPSLKNTPAICLTLLPWRWINRVHCSDSPTMGSSDYPNPLSFSYFFVALVQLIAVII